MPRPLLAWDVPAAPTSELAAMVESQLVRLAACEARLDLDVGIVVATFSMKDIHDLGHGTRADFCRERLGISASHAGELRNLSTRLKDLPLLRRAFLSGGVPRTRLRGVAAVATPATQADWMIAMTVLTAEQLARRVAAAKGAAREGVRGSEGTGPEGDGTDPTEPEEATERVRVRLSADAAAFIECVGLPMLRAVVGHEGPKHALLHALAADTLADLGPEASDDAEVTGVRGTGQNAPNASCCERSHAGTGRRRAARRRRQAEKNAKRIVHRLLARMGGLPAVSWPAPAGDLATLSLAGRLAHAQRLASWRRGLEWQRARLLSLFRARAWHRAAGFRNFFEWLDRRLSLAPREAVTLCRLADDLSPLRELEDAWRDGALGWSEAGMVARIASPATAADWVSFAAESTKKRLEIDIAAHVALRASSLARWHQITNGGRPLRDMPSAGLRVQWERVFDEAGHRRRAEREARRAARAARRAARKARHAGEGGSWKSAPSPSRLDIRADVHGGEHRADREKDLLAFPTDSRRRATFAFDAPPSVAEVVRQALRQVRRATGGVLSDGDCLVQMFHRFAATHVVPGLQDLSLRARVLLRDGYQCSMPHCRSRRNLEVHHARYRSRGGSDDEENLTTLCHACHRLEHDGALQIVSEGPQVTRAGRGPMLVVRVGREGPGLPAPRGFRDGIRVA